MATVLNDKEIAKLLGSVISDGDPEAIRPNSYVLRLGASGAYLNTGKEFTLGDKKKGLRVQPGHSVAVTALETIDFRRETVQKIYPDADLHALISPTTDLSREGIVAPTTQVDAGYHGTLNWTIANTSSEERRFLHKERLFRLTIFKLDAGERPHNLYAGHYQSQTGYVPSQRRGAPVSMKDGDWEDAHTKGSPEDLLDNLLKSGYPWHALGQRLKLIDRQFQSVTDEYAEIRDAIERLTADVSGIRDRQGETSTAVRDVLREETSTLQHRWLIGSGSLIIGATGLALAVTSSPVALDFLRQNGGLVSIGLLALSVAGWVFLSRARRGSSTAAPRE